MVSTTGYIVIIINIITDIHTDGSTQVREELGLIIRLPLGLPCVHAYVFIWIFIFAGQLNIILQGLIYKHEF